MSDQYFYYKDIFFKSKHAKFYKSGQHLPQYYAIMYMLLLHSATVFHIPQRKNADFPQKSHSFPWKTCIYYRFYSTSFFRLPCVHTSDR